MSRNTKVVGLSLPPEINKKVERHLKKTYKTRSEFFREMIALYFKKETAGTNDHVRSNKPTEADLATILKNYWDTKSTTKLKVIPIVLAIITNPENKILIGARGGKDEWVDNLSWVFPGGNLKTLNFEKEIKKIVKNETGIDVTVKDLVSARIHPDSGFKEAQIVALYFYCETSKKVDVKPTKDLQNIKWVKPLDVFKYFTTSTSDDVTKFLATLHKSKK